MPATTLPPLSVSTPMLNPDHLESLLLRYGLQPEGAEYLGGSQNHVYAARTADGEKRILRVSTGRHRTRLQVRAELEWVTFLGQRGVNACQPLPTTTGQRCIDLDVDGHSYTAACFEFAPGQLVGPEDVNVALYEKLGALMGRMHTAAKEFSKKAKFLPRLFWYESRLLREDVEEMSGSLTKHFRECVAYLIESMRQAERTPDTHGLIHSDVSFGNFSLHEGELWIFDFDNCEFGFFIQDLATALYDSIYCKVLDKSADPGLTGRMLPLWRALLKGYASTGPLKQIDPAMLRKFFLLREAAIYVHYHRTLDIAKMDDSFKAGLEVMRKNVESQSHQVDFARLL